MSDTKTVLITGGSRGIGAACVRLFSAKGWSAAFCWHNSAEAAAELSRETGALAIQADVSDSRQVSNMARLLESAFPHLDVLVNNAGISETGLLTDLTDEKWDRLMAVNVGGVFNCCRAFLPGMIGRKAGAIVNVSSIWGMTGASCEAAYSASKAAVIGLTKALAKETGPSGIRINCVAPGVIDTDMNSELDKEAIGQLCCDTPLGRLGTPDEAARAIYFLASEDASFITGQVISPNGGFVI